MTPDLLTDASLLSLVVSIIVGYGIPFLRDLVLAADAPDKVKSVAATVMSTLGGVLPSVAWNGDVGNYIVNVLMALVAAVVPIYFGHSQLSQKITGGKGLVSKADFTTAA